nr:MAG TPA: hypothetical protein [Bacteriophage sp.]
MAVIGKRAVHRHESCRTYANIEPYRRTSYRYGSFSYERNDNGR